MIIIPAIALAARSLVRTADPTNRDLIVVRCADRAALAEVMIKAQRRDNLLAQNDLSDAVQTPSIIWILIDCMPAMRILRGSEALLRQSSIIWLRVLLEPVQGIDADATLVAINDYLSTLGYCFPTRCGKPLRNRRGRLRARLDCSASSNRLIAFLYDIQRPL